MNKRICGKLVSILESEFAYNTKGIKTTFLAPAWDFAITPNDTANKHLCYNVIHVNTKTKWNSVTIL